MSEYLASGTLALTVSNLYAAPPGVPVRIEVIHISNGLAGSLTLQIEDEAGVSHNLINGLPLLANASPVEMRDLILEPGWLLRGFFSATGSDFHVFGTEVVNPPSNPTLKVLAKTTLTGSTPVAIYTVPPQKRARITHIVVANSATTGVLTLQTRLSGGSARNYANQLVFSSREVKEFWDIPLDGAGDAILAAGQGDASLYGLEFDVA